jgi:shikimate kinase
MTRRCCKRGMLESRQSALNHSFAASPHISINVKVPANRQSGRKASAPRIVALTGFMGAGKTSVGRELAALLGWKFFDLDQEIEQRQKLPIREMFQVHGELRFRKIEADTFRTILKQVSAPTVIALGGGTFIQSRNADLLQACGARVVFLETPMKQLLHRCRVAAQSSAANLRPLAADRDAFRALYSQRLPHYRTAQITVRTAGKTIEEIAAQIASSLRLAAGAR